METPQLIVLNLILLMLVFVINVKVHAETGIDIQRSDAHYWVGAGGDKKMAASVQEFDYTDAKN